MDLPLLTFVANWFGLLREEKGQSLVEYGLIIVLVGIAVTVALTALAGGLSNLFQTVSTCLSGGTC